MIVNWLKILLIYHHNGNLMMFNILKCKTFNNSVGVYVHFWIERDAIDRCVSSNFSGSVFVLAKNSACRDKERCSLFNEWNSCSCMDNPLDIQQVCEVKRRIIIKMHFTHQFTTSATSMKQWSCSYPFRIERVHTTNQQQQNSINIWMANAKM